MDDVSNVALGIKLDAIRELLETRLNHVDENVKGLNDRVDDLDDRTTKLEAASNIAIGRRGALMVFVTAIVSAVAGWVVNHFGWLFPPPHH